MEEEGNYIFREEIEAQVDLKVGIHMAGDFELAELGRHVVKKYIAQMQVGMVGRVHHHVVILGQELIIHDKAPFHVLDYGEGHPAGLRGIVLEQLGQGGAIRVSGLRIFRGRVLPDPGFGNGDKNTLDGAASRKLGVLLAALRAVSKSWKLTLTLK